jgi:hypothetical protein
MRKSQAVTYGGSIKGFNRQWTALTNVKVQIGKERKTVGHQFECACGTVKKFLSTYFYDTHAAAMAALETHRCITK